MLKFVQSRPPRARSSSPASSAAFMDRAAPRPRDRSYPPFPPVHHPHPHHPHYPGPPREGEGIVVRGGGLSVPRNRGGRWSPGASSRAPPSRAVESALQWEGDYDTTFPGTATYPARDRGRVSYPPHPDLPSTRRYPASDRGRPRHCEWPRSGVGGGGGERRFPVGDRDRERQYRGPPPSATTPTTGRQPPREERHGGRPPEQWTPQHHPGMMPTPEREKPRTSSPRDRHVRISPHPVEEIPRTRSAQFPERDRSTSPASSSAQPQSILSKSSSRDKARAQQQQHGPPQIRTPPATMSRGPPTMISREGPPVVHLRSHSAEGSREYHERSWGPEFEATREIETRPRALTEPSVSFTQRPAIWARPHVEREPGLGRKEGGEWRGEGGGEGVESDSPSSAKDRLGSKARLLFSGNWLHGPSRHRIFASKSAQPPVMTTCVPQVSNDLSNEALNKTQSDRSVGQSSQGSRGIMSSLRDMLNRSQDGTGPEELLLDMTYVTERIISMSFPSEGHDTTYAFNLKDVVRMLKTKHGDNYLVLNLSEKRQDLVRANPQVKDYGWPDHLAPPLERLCSVCKAMDAWLHADPRNVAVLHCKGGRARIAIIIAAYMHYSNICASADQALDRFAMKRFYEDKLGGLPLPSQRRYLHYFAGLLSGAIKINTNPLYLHHILIHGVPNFDTRGGCRPFIKVYQGMQPIFMSGVYNVTDNMQKVCISISPGIPLRGDILIKCYHKKARTGQREVIWQCQFHTCAVQVGNVVFSKLELDDAIQDPRFPDNGKVEFVFGPSSDVSVSVSGFKSDVTVPVDDNEESVTRSDSYENFYKALALQGTQSYAGPRDVSYGSHQQQTEQASSSYISQVNSPRSNVNSTLTRSAVGGPAEDQLNSNSLPPQQQPPAQQLPAPTFDERSQLDNLLSDLLSDQLIVTSPKSPQSPSAGPHSPLSPLSPPSGAKTMTTAAHAYSSYSNTDSGALRSAPADSVFVQRADVSYASPGQVVVEPDRSRVPKGAFSYTPTSPTRTDKVHTIERTDHVTSLQQSPPSRTHTLPYRTDYDAQPLSSTDGEPLSWLQQQQQKLQRMRMDSSGRTEQEKQLLSELKVAQDRYFRQRAHSEAEEQAVMDSYRQPSLHNGPVPPASAPPIPYAPPPSEFGGEGGHFNTFTQSQSQHLESHYTSGAGGGGERPSTKPPPSPTMQRSIQQVSSPPVQPPVRSSSKDYMRSRTQSSSSSGSAWQASSSSTPPPTATRPLVRQYSETLYDREQRLQAQRAPSSQSTPPLSPRALSPSQVGAGTTYTTYRTIHKEMHDQHHPRIQPVAEHQQVVTVPVMRSPPPQSPPQHHPHPPLSPDQQAQHNYITEVFVHRMGGENAQAVRPEGGEETRLDELTRSLQAASESIMEERVSHSSQQQQQQPKQQQLQQQQVQQQQQHRINQTWQEQHQTQSQVHKGQEGPAPRPLGVVEEDRFSLRPIGPGMQTLEPDTVHSQSGGTLTRSAQPTSPETPPFPVSPRTAIQGATGGSSGGVASPAGGTLSSQSVVQQQQEQYHQQYQQHQQQQPPPQQQQQLQQPPPQQLQQQQQQQYLQQQQQQFQQQQQYQQQQQQQYQQQQFQQQHVQQQASDGSLHIDTSQRMLSPGAQARSPSSAGSPQSPSNLNTLRKELSTAHSMSGSATQSHSITGQSSPSVYLGLSRRGSLSSLAESEMIPTIPKFVKDMSKYWYKPGITREEAITLLKDREPGTFVIRDSNSFPGAYGLALKVAQIPTNVQTKPSSDPQSELVRHFLIEPTPKGVRLRGCSNEPTFGTLASLVYQHTITPLALPCKLVLPDSGDTVDGPCSPDPTSPELNSAAELLAKGAACTVVFLNTVDTESLTGPQAIAKAIDASMESVAGLATTQVHFKVSSQGITLTDIHRKLFFRRHYPVSSVTYCGMDSKGKRWKRHPGTPKEADAMIFGFVARKQGAGSDNSCHLFAELEPNQPASAIVNFITKVMIGHSKVQS